MLKLQVIRCKVSQSFGQLAKYLVKLGKGMGKSFPGYLYLKLGNYHCLRKLAQEPTIGNIIFTGTNGKTTSTKMACMLLSKDTQTSCTFDSNTLNAIATGLLSPCKLGLFEYGIRDTRNSFPDLVCELIDPIGVVYTTISREHTMVAGRKNPFEKYFKAKELLSAPMKRGIVVCNADDPRTAYIGKKKESNTLVTYYGLEVDFLDEDPLTASISCPHCNIDLNYQKRYFNHRGLYKCKCGFSRPKPQVKISNITQKHQKWELEIKGETYNYPTQKDVSLNIVVEIPILGLHNIYNLLCAVATYLSFTPNPDKVKETIMETCSQLDNFELPPGRFEIFQMNHKMIGMGQGDNGDALKANIQLFSGKEEILVYLTPDEGEDLIFQDHLNVIKSSHFKKIHVFPGRESVSAAENYYNTLKESFESEFHPISNKNLKQKINEIIDITNQSPSQFLVISGCGPEHLLWDKLKSSLKSQEIN